MAIHVRIVASPEVDQKTKHNLRESVSHGLPGLPTGYPGGGSGGSGTTGRIQLQDEECAVPVRRYQINRPLARVERAAQTPLIAPAKKEKKRLL